MRNIERINLEGLENILECNALSITTDVGSIFYKNIHDIYLDDDVLYIISSDYNDNSKSINCLLRELYPTRAGGSIELPKNIKVKRLTNIGKYKAFLWRRKENIRTSIWKCEDKITEIIAEMQMHQRTIEGAIAANKKLKAEKQRLTESLQVLLKVDVETFLR